MKSDELAITSGAALTADAVVDCDVCVVGSGCGGATVACRLAESGRSVIVVEQGGSWSSKDFDQREVNMLAKIDGARGLDTSKDGGANFTYGNNIGGASVHYWADSYRTPPDRLARWDLPGHALADLTPHFEVIERDLNVHTVDDAGGYENQMNLRVRDAARALGWHVAKVPQARKGCVRSGHCMQGCFVDAKQSQLVTHLPRAIAAGARVYSDVRALSFTSSGDALTGTVKELRCAVVDRASGAVTSRTLTVRAKAFVVAAGGYATPELLLRQGLKERLPHLGEHFFCNPCAQAYALFDDDVIWWRNIPAAWGVEQFRVATMKHGAYVEGGYLLMPNQLQPGTLAACLLLPPKRQREVMAQMKKLGGTIAWIDDADDGRVWLEGGVDGRRRVHVPLDGQNGLQLKDTMRKQTRLLLQAGAREVFFGDVHDTRVMRGASAAQIDDAVARWDLRPARNVFATPHPGGAARMGADARTSVVGYDHRVHGTDNLFVADPSVFPTAPSVDPSVSIMAFSCVAAAHVHAAL
jgi:choline dehydrogenase-like flavoprotein